MPIKVINNIECTCITHEAPRIISINSCEKFTAVDAYIELEVDNHIYRVLAKDLQDAVLNATRKGI